jgi:DNA replication protein DnaC
MLVELGVVEQRFRCSRCWAERRYLKGSVILTTNRGVASWGDIFSDTTIAAAMLDRLLHRSVVF